MADVITNPYQFNLPSIGGSDDTWGDKLNADIQKLNNLLVSGFDGGTPTAIGILKASILPDLAIDTFTFTANPAIIVKNPSGQIQFIEDAVGADDGRFRMVSFNKDFTFRQSLTGIFATERTIWSYDDSEDIFGIARPLRATGAAEFVAAVDFLSTTFRFRNDASSTLSFWDEVMGGRVAYFQGNYGGNNTTWAKLNRTSGVVETYVQLSPLRILLNAGGTGDVYISDGSNGFVFEPDNGRILMAGIHTQLWVDGLRSDGSIFMRNSTGNKTLWFVESNGDEIGSLTAFDSDKSMLLRVEGSAASLRLYHNGDVNLVGHLLGIDFGSVAVADPLDLTGHIALFGTTYGISISSSSFNFVAPDAAKYHFRKEAMVHADGGFATDGDGYRMYKDATYARRMGHMYYESAGDRIIIRVYDDDVTNDGNSYVAIEPGNILLSAPLLTTNGEAILAASLQQPGVSANQSAERGRIMGHVSDAAFNAIGSTCLLRWDGGALGPGSVVTANGSNLWYATAGGGSNNAVGSGSTWILTGDIDHLGGIQFRTSTFRRRS